MALFECHCNDVSGEGHQFSKYRHQETLHIEGVVCQYRMEIIGKHHIFRQVLLRTDVIQRMLALNPIYSQWKHISGELQISAQPHHFSFFAFFFLPQFLSRSVFALSISGILFSFAGWSFHSDSMCCLLLGTVMGKYTLFSCDDALPSYCKWSLFVHQLIEGSK